MDKQMDNEMDTGGLQGYAFICVHIYIYTFIYSIGSRTIGCLFQGNGGTDACGSPYPYLIPGHLVVCIVFSSLIPDLQPASSRVWVLGGIYAFHYAAVFR